MVNEVKKVNILRMSLSYMYAPLVVVVSGRSELEGFEAVGGFLGLIAEVGVELVELQGGPTIKRAEKL